MFLLLSSKEKVSTNFFRLNVYFSPMDVVWVNILLIGWIRFRGNWISWVNRDIEEKKEPKMVGRTWGQAGGWSAIDTLFVYASRSERVKHILLDLSFITKSQLSLTTFQYTSFHPSSYLNITLYVLFCLLFWLSCFIFRKTKN